MTKHKYTKEMLEEAVASSYSIMEVMRKLGIKLTGGSHYHISNKIRRLEIDTSHFKRQGWSKGLPSRNRKTSEDILVVLPDDSRRPRRLLLKRSMLELGVKYVCDLCGIDDWQEKEICLDIDHINGNWLDNRIENLGFLCPNCHSQTATFGNKRR